MARGYVVEKNGRWYIQIFDDTGRSTMRSVAKELGKKDATEKDAQKLLWRRLAEADNDGIAYSAKITLDKYLHDWIQLKKPTIAQSTYECYLEKIDKHIVPRIGDLRLDQLNKATMKRFLNSLIDDGIGTRTIQLTMRQVLSQALTQACEDELLKKNPMQGIHTPAYTRKEKIMWTDKELNAFLAVAKERPLYPVYMLAITTGMPEEVLKNQVLKYQFPSPFSLSVSSSKTRVTERFKIRPFRFLLKLLCDKRIGCYLTQEEVGRVVAVEASDETTEIYEKVIILKSN